MKGLDYISPTSEVFQMESTGCLLSSAKEQMHDARVISDTTNMAKPNKQVGKLQMGKLIVLAAAPRTFFSKVNVSINDKVVEEIKEKGKFIIPIEKNCEVKFRWRQAFTSKYITACANEIKIVKMTYGQNNIKLNETVYARDGIKLEIDETEGNKSNRGLKIAGTVALGVLAALAGEGADFDADVDTDIDLDLDGDGINDSLAFDSDGDGTIDSIAADTDGDGVFDTFGADTDGDGYIDTFGVDSDGDGLLDAIGEDANADGVFDTFAVDTDHDGTFDHVGLDTNFDGNIDTVAVDLDSDGSFDVAGMDIDNDGDIDIIDQLY